MESSGITRRAMRERGIDAWSCDILPSVDNSPYHIIGDVFDQLDKGWDGAIFHPTCTYLTISAEWAYKDPDYERYPGVGYHQKVKPETLVGAARRAAREKALVEFARLLNCEIPKVAIENPVGVASTRIRPYSQKIQPFEFGDDASKGTCLWLRGWPLLVADPARRIAGRMVEYPRGSGKIFERWSNQTDSNQNKLTPSDNRWSERSKTYQGIANAFADQYAPILLRERGIAA
jgi:hypothetical protein